MIKSERQATQSLRKHPRPGSIAAARAALKEGYGFLKRKHIECDLIGYLAPVREPRRDQHTRPSGWQKVRYVIRRGDIVVDEEPCRMLFCQSAQGSLCRTSQRQLLLALPHPASQQGSQEHSKGPCASRPDTNRRPHRDLR